MKCEMCGGTMREEVSIYTGKSNSTVVVIKNIKALKCDQCGDEMYKQAESELISKIAKKVREIPFELVVTDANKWR